MSAYLSSASKLADKAVELSAQQKVAIENLNKDVQKHKEILELALEAINRDEKKGKLTEMQAKLERATASIEIEGTIKVIHQQIKGIDPNFVSNAEDLVKSSLNNAAYYTVVGAGKAAGWASKIVRPLFQAAREAYQEMKDGVNEPIPAPKKTSSRLETLESL